VTAGQRSIVEDGGALRFDLILPVLRIGVGIFSFSPIERLLGASLDDVLEPLRIAPVERRPSASGTAVEVHHLALPEGEGLAIPLGQFGEIGLKNDCGLLALTVPVAWGARLAGRLGAALVRGPERGRSLDGAAEVVTCWVRLRVGMRAALPLAAFGDLAIEAG
jgi:hypothetical protein